MPSRTSRARYSMYNTPAIRTGGFGALQVEALTNRPLSIARRHLAASQLRMRDIEPDELSSSEWCRFLVMESRERERWMGEFVRRRRESSASSSSSSSSSSSAPESSSPSPTDRTAGAAAKAREAAAEEGGEEETERAQGTTPAVSLWVRQFDGAAAVTSVGGGYSARRPRHTRRAATTAGDEAPPPTYESVVRPGTPPPAYEPRR